MTARGRRRHSPTIARRLAIGTRLARRRLASTWRVFAARLRTGWAWAAAQAARLARLGLAGARIAVLLGIVSFVLAGGALAASRLYGQFGGQQSVVNARAWANRTEAYAVVSCRSCHQTQSDAKIAGLHVSVTCEACHGPQGDHPGSDPNILTRLQVPTSDACVTCHADTAGRPSWFPAVTLTTHYGGGLCLRCHDPHTIAAVAPPEVTHPLANLPACTTCHNPNGLKKVPSGHELVADDVCLSCHATPERTR
jgi:hypothetical protein